jgi:hypothetical protein
MMRFQYILDIVAVDEIYIGCIGALIGSLEVINGFDVLDHDKDTTGEDQQK